MNDDDIRTLMTNDNCQEKTEGAIVAQPSDFTNAAVLNSRATFSV
jgi:hypothetical protein